MRQPLALALAPVPVPVAGAVHPRHSRAASWPPGNHRRSAPAAAAQVALVGAPNVGKSSLVQLLSSGLPEVQNYPFTTRSIKMGHFYVEGRRHQVTGGAGWGQSTRVFLVSAAWDAIPLTGSYSVENAQGAASPATAAAAAATGPHRCRP